DHLKQNSLAEGGADRLRERQLASDGSDHLKQNSLAYGANSNMRGTRVAEGGSDRLMQNRVADGGFDFGSDTNSDFCYACR
ncbi:hypothetical protein, partial [Pseudomonas mandelii]